MEQVPDMLKAAEDIPGTGYLNASSHGDLGNNTCAKEMSLLTAESKELLKSGYSTTACPQCV